MAVFYAASPCIFRLVWICIAVSYLVCGTALMGKSLLYYFIHTADVIAGVTLLGVNVHPALFPYMTAATLTIALIHFYHLATMIIVSARARSLKFPTRKVNGLSSRIAHALAKSLDAALPQRSSCLGFTLRSLGDVTQSLWSAFDVSSSNYGVVYILRELVQTAIQTNQAYQMSAHVASPWMNHTIVFLLVVNCWAMPLIHYILKISSTRTARLLCLIVNFLLDFASYFALPIVLLVPYTKVFDFSITSFRKELWYTDVWVMQLKNEWPLLFTTSVSDGLSRLLIVFSMTRTLRSIAKLLQQSSEGPDSDPFQHSPYPLASVIPTARSSPSMKSVTTSLTVLPREHRIRLRAEEWGHRCLAVWGFLILILHTQASCTKTNPLCLLQVRPWFVRRPVCSLMDFNCLYDSNLIGNASQFDVALASIDNEWLAYLVIRHCPSVEITPSIRDLSWLMGIKIFNSTLVQWGVDAALTQTHHPNMLFAYVISTKMTVFPLGLYHEDFPLTLMDIEFSFVNLTELPDELVDRWHAGMFLVMEGLQLRVFPDVLTKLHPSLLSLACNNFTSIPDAIFENQQLVGLILNDNPISELPSRQDPLVELCIAKTRILLAPLWFDVSHAVYPLQAGTTPLCEALLQRNRSQLGISTDAEMELWHQYVDCTPANELRYLTQYPVTEEAINNPSRII